MRKDIAETGRKFANETQRILALTIIVSPVDLSVSSMWWVLSASSARARSQWPRGPSCTRVTEPSSGAP